MLRGGSGACSPRRFYVLRRRCHFLDFEHKFSIISAAPNVTSVSKRRLQIMISLSKETVIKFKRDKLIVVEYIIHSLRITVVVVM